MKDKYERRIEREDFPNEYYVERISVGGKLVETRAYSNGALNRISRFRDGYRIVEFQYDHEGKLRNKASYDKNGEYHGDIERYFEGVLTGTAEFQHGHKHGKELTFDL